MKLTENQQSVIDTRGKSILVAAAAGSGKTMVMVERIITMITDENNPVDIDKILVVTFTKAAASSMKAKIHKAIKARLKENPKDKNLLKQLSLVGIANICTIDSFCMDLVKNNFNAVGLEPDFKIADSGSLSLLSDEVLEEVIENAHKSKDKDFRALCDSVIKKTDKKALGEMIKTLYDRSVSYPWPEDYLDSLMSPFLITDEAQLKELSWYKKLSKQIEFTLEEPLARYKELLEEAMDTLLIEEGEHHYIESFRADIEALSRILENPNPMEDFFSFKFTSLKSKKYPDEDNEARTYIKSKRDDIKTDVEKIQKLCVKAEDEVRTALLLRPRAEAIIRVTKEYQRQFLEQKKQQNLLDFSDIEHAALEILIDKNTRKATEIAELLKATYVSVCVDEYQDSNALQELILSTVSSESEGRYNYFMVGDVKQSIYRFRKARPDIFIGKQKAFGNDGENTKLICLSNNFRSRKAVVDTVNDVFLEIMKRDLGGVEYDDEAKLIFSADYTEDAPCNETEIYVVDSGDEDAKSLHLSKEELEARAVGEIIKKTLKETKVYDKGVLRPAKPSDITILHRSGNKVSSKYEKVLAAMDIPLNVVGAEGYFESFEIESLLAMLTILNNPIDDIPLCGVLSNFYDITSDELAMLRGDIEKKYTPFSQVVFDYCKGEGINPKYERFYRDFLYLRDYIPGHRIYEVIYEIIRLTDFKTRLFSMDMAKLRLTNVNKLISLAVSFENNSKFLLYDFINYVSDLRKYNIEQSISGEDKSQAVTFMTIHKSKGLEFPICIVAGLGTKFKDTTAQGGMIISESDGIALDYVDRKKRIKYKTGFSRALSGFEKIENTAESQRLLYVALTRPMEKLILVGSLDDKKYEKLMDRSSNLSYSKRLGAESFLHMILPVLNHKGYKIQRIGLSDLVVEATVDTVKKIIDINRLEVLSKEANENDLAEFRKRLDFKYKDRASLHLKNKYSVSELKSIHRELGDEEENLIEKGDNKKLLVPTFISGDTGLSKNAATQRGTATHRFMECVAFDGNFSFEDTLKDLLDRGILIEEDAALLEPAPFHMFFETNLAKRMIEAQKRGELFREKTFAYGIPKGELIGDFSYDDAEELVLIQGVIDAYFIEDGIVYVLDYKTDKVNNENELIEKYDKQLLYYKRALAGIYPENECKKLIYSFTLNKEISL